MMKRFLSLRPCVVGWFLFLVCGACNDPGEHTDAGLRDGAGDGEAHESEERNFIRVGSASTLEVATWNLHNFPSEATSSVRVASLLADMDLDLVAVQEIADSASFDSVLQNLNSHQGVLSEHEYSPGNYQKVGFVFRSDLMRLISTQLLFEDDAYAFPRPALRADFDVDFSTEFVLHVVLINVHLKAGDTQDDRERRRIACEELKEFVDRLLTQNGLDHVIVLGDFNDELSDEEEENVFEGFVQDTGSYEFLTQPLSQAGVFSYIPYRRLLDHILITKALEDDYQGGQTGVINLHEKIETYDYQEVVSDHLPVVALMPRDN